MLAVITREFQLSNYVEAALWIALGLASLVQGVRSRGVVRRELIVLAVNLIAFGFSDVVETQTGAWWKPPWLLAWKVVCVAVMLVLLILYIKRRVS
jgi:hypothetical protein